MLQSAHHQSLRNERSDRGNERGDRSDRSNERGDRSDRSNERGDRSDRSNERGDRSDRSSDRADRGDRGGDRVEVIKLPSNVTSNGLYSSKTPQGKDSSDSGTNWSGMNLSAKASESSAPAPSLDDQAPLNLSFKKSSETSSKSSTGSASSLNNSTNNLNSLASLSSITAALGSSDSKRE